jgi:transcription-repair coupling factor (superfamily II helicase)
MTAERILMGGAPEGFDARILVRELARGAAVVHVARDDKRAEAMRAALAVMAPEVVVLDFPAWDCLPFDRVSPNPEICARRMATLAVLADGLKGPFVLLTTLTAATQKVPTREVVKAASFRASVGERVDEARLKGFLARMASLRSRPLRNRATTRCGAGSLTSSRRGAAGRSGWTSSAMSWTARGGSIPRRSGRLRN